MYFGKAAVENFQKISGSNKLQLNGIITEDSNPTETKIAKG